MNSFTILTLFWYCLFLMVKASPVPGPLPEAIPADNQALACQPSPNGNGNQQHEVGVGGGGGVNESPEEKEGKTQQEEEKKRKKEEEKRRKEDEKRKEKEKKRKEKEEKRKQKEKARERKEKARERKEKERERKEKEREKKEKQREQKDAERAKADEEHAREESKQKPTSENQGGGGSGGGSGMSGGRGTTNPPPPTQGGNNNKGGGVGGTIIPPPPTQGGNNNKGGGVGVTTIPPPPSQGGNNKGSSVGGQGVPPKQQSPGTKPPPATTPVGGKTYTGPATFYGGNLEGGNCMLTGYRFPPNVFGAAIGGNNWENSGNCGACAEVRGPDDKKITVMFCDKCPECGDGIDLFPDAFEQLNNPSVGRFTVNWNFVECPVQGPLKIKDKEGTNEYYVSMQVQNGREATQSLEISADGGKTYKMGQREDSNHFVFNGQVGAQVVDVRVTSKTGKTVVIPGVPVAGAEKVAAQNYE